MKPACPNCFATVNYVEHGGLYSVRCSSCGWHQDGTVNRALLGSINPGPALVVRAEVPVSVDLLKVVRAEVNGASALSFEELRSKLTSGEGLWLGNVPAYKLDALRAALVAAGARIERSQHEEG